MVRYSYALRGQPKDPEKEIRLEEQQIDNIRGEQLTEQYLCDVNSAAEVPVIKTVDGASTLPDSLEITKYLAGFYPSWMPDPWRREIPRLPKRLHRTTINFLSLIYVGRPEGQHMAKKLLQKESASNPSARYEQAIRRKMQR